MHTRLSLSVVLTVLASGLAAQGFLVTPSHYATWEGTTASSLPFSGTAFPVRFQQIHTEPSGAPTLMRWLAFRRDARGPDARFASRQVDLDLWMGHGSHAGASNSFSANYLSTPQNVFLRKVVSTPDWSGLPRVSPAPFELALPLDTPFLHDGARDFVWEANVFGASGTGTIVLLDAVSSGMNIVIPANYELQGIGCTVNGSEMLLRSGASLQAFPVNGWIYDWAATACPPSSPTVLLVGALNPSLPLPGLCTNVHVLPLVDVPGMSDAAGAFDPLPNTSPLPRSSYFAGMVGARLEAQVAAIDSSGVPRLVASNGCSTILPPWTPVVGIARLYQTPTTSPTLSTISGVPVAIGY